MQKIICKVTARQPALTNWVGPTTSCALKYLRLARLRSQLQSGTAAHQLGGAHDVQQQVQVGAHALKYLRLAQVEAVLGDRRVRAAVDDLGAGGGGVWWCELLRDLDPLMQSLATKGCVQLWMVWGRQAGDAAGSVAQSLAKTRFG